MNFNVKVHNNRVVLKVLLNSDQPFNLPTRKDHPRMQ